MSVAQTKPPQLSRPAGENGFTLMEVLIAVTITAVIGIGVWQVLGSVVTSRDRVNEVAEQFDELQRAMLLLERDITQVVNRPARDIYGDFTPALTNRQDDFVLMLTRQGWRNPTNRDRSMLQRVGWEYTGEELRRRYWGTVDMGQEDNSRDLLLLSDVSDFAIRFLDHQRNWQDNWPDENNMANMTPGTRPNIPLPLGIEITLEHEHFGELVRIFYLPDFDYDAAQGVINTVNDSADDQDDDQTQDQDQTGGGGTGG